MMQLLHRFIFLAVLISELFMEYDAAIVFHSIVAVDQSSVEKTVK